MERSDAPVDIPRAGFSLSSETAMRKHDAFGKKKLRELPP
jgi:hypothetical protein